MRKQLTRRNFRPAEALERRIALSAQVGINLDSNANYNGDPIWTDLHNLATNWSSPLRFKPRAERGRLSPGKRLGEFHHRRIIPTGPTGLAIQVPGPSRSPASASRWDRSPCQAE